jgi:hypothetical protein
MRRHPSKGQHMNKILIDEDVVKLALEALKNSVDLVSNDAREAEKMYANVPTRLARVQGLVALEVAHEKAINALQKLLADNALDKKAQNARELGLDYEPAPQPDVQQEPVAWMHWLHGPVRLFLNKDEAMMELDRLNREYPVDADGRKMRPLVFGDISQQPAQQEPVAWGFQNSAITGSNRWMMLREEIPANDQYGGALWTPLYTSSPAQRTWVGLTTKEIREWWASENGLEDCLMAKLDDFEQVARAIEAKLKEKNT